MNRKKNRDTISTPTIGLYNELYWCVGPAARVSCRKLIHTRFSSIFVEYSPVAREGERSSPRWVATSLPLLSDQSHIVHTRFQGSTYLFLSPFLAETPYSWSLSRRNDIISAG